MDKTKLAAAMRQPWVHHALLGDYKGAYSLGVGLNDAGRPALRLRVPDASVVGCYMVEIDGEEIDVLVDDGFDQPRPLRGQFRTAQALSAK